MSDDPFDYKPGKKNHHAAEHIMLMSLAEMFRLYLHFLTMVWSTPGGPWNSLCLGIPITRIPIGETVATCLPSVLDYGLGSRGCVLQCHLRWNVTPADHALVVSTVDANCFFQKSLKTHWKFKDETGCVAFI